ncbi:hypothetical protein CMV_025432 [Castanea mollissima]|uniref:Uncharacterized protein n=1 Tax=Castanea mollissima TaxID=60419 RepID=A0A8J4QLZ2_9ROSI|nr:hypothetical protein CMV_025432 [Castanea mollissima]
MMITTPTIAAISMLPLRKVNNQVLLSDANPNPVQTWMEGEDKPMAQGLNGQWSIILKIYGVRQRRKKRGAFAYEARTRQGAVVFYGCSRSAAKSLPSVLLEGLREVAVTASRFQFNQILVLSNSNFLVQLLNTGHSLEWE